MKKKKHSLQPAARKLAVHSNPRSMVSEQYRTIRTSINFTKPKSESQVLLFTSASQAEGKSTTVSNIAVAFAEEGRKVLLVDGDMRKPTVQYTFQLSNSIGLSSLLTRRVGLHDAIRRTHIPRLDVITCGPIPMNPAELLESDRLATLVQEMKEEYDVVLFDSPPVLSVTDARILASRCDGTIMVVNAGKSEKESVRKARETLLSSQTEVIGAVLNNYALDKDHYYYQSYGNF